MGVVGAAVDAAADVPYNGPMALPTFTWPNWKSAPSGTRFRHVRTGRTGVLIGPAKNPHNGAIVKWDESPFPTKSVDGEPGHVFFVGIARDAEPI